MWESMGRAIADLFLLPKLPLCASSLASAFHRQTATAKEEENMGLLACMLCAVCLVYMVRTCHRGKWEKMRRRRYRGNESLTRRLWKNTYSTLREGISAAFKFPPKNIFVKF